MPRSGSPPRHPTSDWDEEAVAARRTWLGIDTPHLAGAAVPTASAQGNIEGLIGFAQVPVGVAGPLALHGDAEGEYLVPFATTEGTLVASYQRGFKVCNAAGGITVRVLADGLVVWPTIAYDRVDTAIASARWVTDHTPALIAAAEATTQHGRVQSLTTEILGRRLVIRLQMFTGDAHGINMVTRAAAAMCALLPSGQVLLHGYDVEKRASAERPRGKWVVADVLIPSSLIASAWRTDARSLTALWTSYSLAFARMGTRTHAIQIANGLAAIYLATGQDVAYVAESATATLSIEAIGDDLHASLDLPTLHAATVGGGTRKGTASECQRILDVGGARELACVMAGALLAGDLNLAASFLGDDFAGAHERLGRNRG